MRARSATLWSAVMVTMLCTAVSQPVMSVPADDAPDIINTGQGKPQRQVAERGLFDLSNRLMAVSNPGTHIFAVDDYQELRNARIGAGFEVNLVDPQALLSGKSISASTHPSGEWRFVVMVGNQAVGLVTVAWLHGHWKMVSAGGGELAKEISHIVSQHSQQDPSERLRFIRSQQGVADFIEVAPPSHNLPSRYVPLLSARIMLARSTDAATLAASPSALAESQIAPDLRASIQRGLSTPSLAH